MKYSHSLMIKMVCATLLLSCFVFAQHAQSQEPDLAEQVLEGYQSQVGLLTEYIEVEHSLLAALLRTHDGKPNADWLREELQALSEKGDARIVESSYLITRSGQRAKLECGREWIYPTEWDPPELPQTLEGPIDRDVVIKTPNAPTAMEMRLVGHTVEVDPVIGVDDSTIELNFAPQNVEFLDNKREGERESAKTIPIFYSQKITTAMVAKSGHSELFAVTTPPSALDEGSEDRRVLGIITPRIVKSISLSDYKSLKEDPKGFADKKFGSVDAVKSNGAAGVVEDDDPFATPEKTARAKVERKSYPTQLSLLVEYIEVDRALAHRIISETDGSCDVTTWRRRLDKQIAKGRANLLESCYGVTRSGQRAKAESVREWTYPTEMGTAEISQTLKGPIEQGVDLITPPSASAFDTRSHGLIMEFDPIIGADGETIELNLAPEMTQLAGELTYGQGVTRTKQPLFESLKVTSAVTTPSGTVFLFGMGSFETARAGKAAKKEEQEEARDRRIMIFLTTKVREVK